MFSSGPVAPLALGRLGVKEDASTYKEKIHILVVSNTTSGLSAMSFLQAFPAGLSPSSGDVVLSKGRRLTNQRSVRKTVAGKRLAADVTKKLLSDSSTELDFDSFDGAITCCGDILKKNAELTYFEKPVVLVGYREAGTTSKEENLVIAQAKVHASSLRTSLFFYTGKDDEAGEIIDFVLVGCVKDSPSPQAGGRRRNSFGGTKGADMVQCKKCGRHVTLSQVEKGMGNCPICAGEDSKGNGGRVGRRSGSGRSGRSKLLRAPSIRKRGPKSPRSGTGDIEDARAMRQTMSVASGLTQAEKVQFKQKQKKVYLDEQIQSAKKDVTMKFYNLQVKPTSFSSGDIHNRAGLDLATGVDSEIFSASAGSSHVASSTDRPEAQRWGTKTHSRLPAVHREAGSPVAPLGDGDHTNGSSGSSTIPPSSGPYPKQLDPFTSSKDVPTSYPKPLDPFTASKNLPAEIFVELDRERQACPEQENQSTTPEAKLIPPLISVDETRAVHAIKVDEPEASDGKELCDVDHDVRRARHERLKEEARLRYEQEHSYSTTSIVKADEMDDEGILISLLNELKLEKYIESFQENEVDNVETLLLLGEEDFKDMGIALGPRKRLLQRIKELQAANKASVAGWGDVDSRPSSTGASLSLERTLEMGRERARTIAYETPPEGLPEKPADGMINYDDLEFGRELGRGNFGVVRKAVWKGFEVAVKEAKDLTDLENLMEFVREAHTMINVPYHENIVNTYGVCSDVLKMATGRALAIVVELCAGSLLDILNSVRGGVAPAALGVAGFRDTQEALLGYAMDVAEGMKHLEAMGMVHRDLALRNIMLSSDGRAKVGDFGMSRLVDHTVDLQANTMNNIVAMRWCAPETQSKEGVSYSKFTDIWAFGVTMWELFTCPSLPYGDLANDVFVFNAVCGGRRLDCPRNCSREVFDSIMSPCWSIDPQERPSYSEIIDRIAALLGKGLSDPSANPPSRYAAMEGFESKGGGVFGMGKRALPAGEYSAMERNSDAAVAEASVPSIMGASSPTAAYGAMQGLGEGTAACSGGSATLCNNADMESGVSASARRGASKEEAAAVRGVDSSLSSIGHSGAGATEGPSERPRVSSLLVTGTFDGFEPLLGAPLADATNAATGSADSFAETDGEDGTTVGGPS